MGVFKRADSPYWWLFIETTQRRERTDVKIGTTAAQRHDSKALAVELYQTRMLGAARTKAGLPEPDAPPTALPTFNPFADWYDTHHISKHAASTAERERGIVDGQLRPAFGALTLDQITKTRVIEWRTTRLANETVVERFGPTSGTPARWRQLHAAMRGRGALTLDQIRALLPLASMDVVGLVTGEAAAPYFTRLRRGVWKAVGTPKIARQVYAPPSAATVNREVDVLQQILQAGVDAGHYTASPLAGLANLPIVKPIRRTMSDAEEAAILTHLAPDDRAITIIALDTLARMINVLDLEWADVHEPDGKLDIRDAKNGDSHTVLMSTRVQAALAALPQDGRYCFPRRRTGASCAARRKAIADALERACAAAGVPYGRAKRGVTFHWGTRRTGATRMIQRGGDKAIAVVKQIGNWKSAEVLIGIYQETLTAEMRAAVESVSAKIPAPRAAKMGQVIPAVFPQKAKRR